MAVDLTTVEARETAAQVLHAALKPRGLDRVRLPNLVGVGTARAATTFLHGLLRSQPAIYVTPVKETNYFGIASRKRMTLREYRMLFIGQDEQPFVAELTPAYLHLPGALEEMAATLDAPKIIVNLREPVARLVSHFKFDASKHGIPDLATYLDQAVDAAADARPWIAPRRVLGLSVYAEALERLFDMFGRENCCLLAYDEVDDDGRRWLAQLSAFLGAELQPLVPDRVFTNASASHPAPMPDTPAAAEILAMFEADAAKLRKLIGDDLPNRWAAARRS